MIYRGMSEIDIKRALDPPRDGVLVDTSVYLVVSTPSPSLEQVRRTLSGEPQVTQPPAESEPRGPK